MATHEGKYALRNKKGEVVLEREFSIEIGCPSSISIPILEEFLLSDLYSIKVISLEEIK